MRRFILPVALTCLLIQTPTSAQSSPSDSFDNNLGSWTWGKHQTPPPSEDDSGSSEDTDEGRGETSWERMTTERSEEADPSTEEQEPKQLTPLDLWRYIWGKVSGEE